MQLAPGFGEEKLAPLAPLQDPGDPKKKKAIAPGFGQAYPALPSPTQQATDSPRLSKNYIAESDLENYMAGQQGGLELIGKTIGQAIPNAILGTVEAVSYLGDLEQMVDKLKGDEAEYTNWLADAMKQAKESIAQDSPLKVFQTADAREGFAPGDATWWAANAPDTIGSALSLMIPAAGVAGLVGKGAKALKMTQGATKVAQGIGATLASRYAESTMEASGVYERAYSDLISKGISPEVARMRAGQQASNVWNTNWIFAVQDFMQYSTLLKGFSSAAKGSVGKSIAEIAKQTASEAGEEAGQFIVGEEAYRAATDTEVDYFGEGFSQRLYEYVRDPEFKASTLLGAFGGGVFTAAGPLGRAAEKGSAKLTDFLSKQVKNIADIGLKKERANYVGDTATSQTIDDVQFTQMAFSKMKEGKLANFKQELENLKTSQGNLGPEVRQNLDNYTQDVDFLADEQAKLKASNIPAELHERVLATKLEQRQLGRLDTSLTNELRQIEQELINNKELAPELVNLKQTQANLEAYKKLAASNKQFQPKVDELQKAYNQLKISGELGFANLTEALTTSRDNDLFSKTFQLVSTKEKQTAVKKNLAELTTPEGIAKARREQEEKKVNQASTAVLNNPDAKVEEILQAAANTKDEALKAALVQKHQALIDSKKVANEQETKAVVDEPPAPIPSEEELVDAPEEVEYNPEMLPPDESGPIEIPFAGGITPDQATRWGGLTKEQVSSILERVEIEQKKESAPVTTQQAVQDQEAVEKRQRTTVPAWLKEVDADNTDTLYTNNLTNEQATADKIFAVDSETGQLLANTPKILPGQEVILRLENDFPWTLTPGFKPDKVDNYVINVYIEGNPRPIKQLPSADNPRLADQKVISQLRNEVIARGELRTKITSKNVGTIRQSPTLNSLEILQSDYIQANEEQWKFENTPHKPILGFIDYNGNITTPNLGGMKGITQNVIDQVNNTQIVPRSNDLAKLKGKVITFRTAPDGTKRVVGLEPRALSQTEIDWLYNNLPKLLNEKDFTTLSNVVYLPQHSSGVYSTKGGKKPDVLNLSRTRIHVVNTTASTADVLIPMKGTQPVWIIVSTNQVESMLTGKAYGFRVMTPDGNKSEVFYNHVRQGEIVTKFKELLAKQFKNVPVSNLNSEIRYTDPVTNQAYDTYYDYLVQTASVQTNLPGSKTLGTGKDSSYSFNQVALYLDPKPQESKFTVTEEGEDTVITNIIGTNKDLADRLDQVEKEVMKKYEKKSNDEALDDFFGPDAKLKPATGSPFQSSKYKKLVYHGTLGSFDTFNEDVADEYNNWTYNGIHFATEKETATAFTEGANMFGKQGRVISAYINVSNPKTVTDSKIPQLSREHWDKEIRTAKNEGYDSLVYKNEVEGGDTTYVVFSPNQISITSDTLMSEGSNVPEGFKLMTEKEINWFKDNIGEEFLQVAKNVDRFVSAKGVEAFGQYYNSLVTIAEYAPEGTAYHEALHFFADPTNGLVTKKQSELINKIGEEKLAEEFEKYKISDGKYKPAESVRGFFRQLWMMIKNLLGFKSPIEKLFKDIDNLALNQAQKTAIQETAKSSIDPAEPRYKKLPGFKYIKQQTEAIAAWTSEIVRLSNELARQEELSLGEYLTNPKNLEVILGTVKSNFETDFNRIKESKDRTPVEKARYLSYLAMGIGTPEPGEESFVGSFEDTTTATGFPEDGFKTKVLKDLSRYGFSVRLKDNSTYTNPQEESAQSVENLELKAEDEAERLYDIDHTLINPSESMSQRVKIFLASIPEPVLGPDGMPTGEAKKTIFGTTKFIDFRRVDGNLALKLRDSSNPITKLTELAEDDAIAKSVLDALMNEKNKGNIQLFNEFAAKYKRDGYYKKTVLYGTKRTPIDRNNPEDIDPENPNATFRIQNFAQTIDSDRASSDRVLHNKWREEAVRKKAVDTDGAVNIKKVTALNTRVEAFKNKFYTAKQKKANLPYTEVKDEFVSILSELGVTIPEQFWKSLDAIPNPGFKYKRLENMFFGTRSRTVEQLMLNAKEGKDPFEGSTVLSNLAKAASVYIDDSRGGAYRNDVGNLENPINWPSALTELANNIKNNPQDIVTYYAQDVFYNDNQFLQAIKNSSDKIDLNFTSVIRRNEDDPKEFERRTEIESILMRLTTFYNNGGNEGFFFTGTPADKTKQPIISLPKKKGVQAAKDFLFTVLKGTMNSEVARIQRLNKFKNAVNDNNPLPKDIANLKNANKFVYIPGLNSIPNLKESLSGGEVSKDQYLEAVKQADKVIEDFINSEFTAFKSFLAENDIINIDENGNITSERIPEQVQDKKSLSTFLEEFFYNDLAWRLEVSKVLMGDIAFYKSPDDYFKRAYQTVTPGIKGYSEQPIALTRAIYAKQMKVNSDEYLNSLAELAGDKSIAEKYKDVNKTDAQSLMDIESYKALSESLGQWSKDHERLYKLAWSKGITVRDATRQLLDQNLITPEQAKRLRSAAAKVLLQPFKPFQFNNRKVTLPDGSTMIIKEQFKDSITPITPELTRIHAGFKDLLAFMKTNKIGIMSAEDTTKVGLYGVISDISQPVQDWQKRVVNLSDFRFPQLLPDKKKEDIKGTQFHKLILGNVDDSTMYKVGSTNMLGKTIKEKYNELWEEKIQNSAAGLQKKLGVGKEFKLSDDKAKRREQLFKLKTTLEQELMSRDLNENYQDVLELVRAVNNEIDFAVPISFPAFGQKFQSILTNLWKKNVLGQDSPGYSAVNLADFGVGYDDELKFVTNNEGQLTEAEIGLPLDNLGQLGLRYGENILPNGRIIWDKLTKAQQEALQFILYRIPTSNKSSMLPVRVVKIVPSNLNNVVIIPGELTIQQGLDFDVDKSQLLRRVTDKEGKIDNDNVDTKLFNIYWGVLTNKAHTKELLTPLASPTLESKFKQYQEMGLIDLGVSSSVASAQADVKAEIRNKDGKAEIGIASRFNTGHTVLQNIKDYVGVNVGIDIAVGGYKFNELGRTLDAAGTLISENHAESQQAALDAAKNPLLAYLGVVTGTMASFHTMIDFGVPLPIITDFFMQPVVREWTKFYKQENQNPNKATEKLMDTYPAIKDQYAQLREGERQYVITPENLKDGLSLSISGNTLHDAAVLLEFRKINMIASQLGKINNVVSIDTFQDATGIEALEAMLQQKNEATNPEALVYIDQRVFDLETAPGTGKRLASFFKHGIQDALNYVGQFFPSTSMAYSQVRTAYAENTGAVSVTNKDLIKQLNQFTDYFNLEGDSLLSRTLTAVHPQKGKEDYRLRWSLFSPEKSLWKYIDQIVEKYPALKANEFIKNLETSRTGEDRVQIVGVRNTDNNTNKTEVTNGWYELLNHPSEEVRGLGHDLVRYSIMTTGFNYNAKSMFELVPVSFWIESGLDNAWKSVVKSAPSMNIDQEAVVVNFIRHNFKNINGFPELYGKFEKDKGFFSQMIKHAKITPKTRHITEFHLSDQYMESEVTPKFIRFNDRELGEYRLYEASPNDLSHFKEVQPLGSRNNFYEVSADGRSQSKAPANRKLNVSSNPWIKPGDNLTLKSLLFDKSGPRWSQLDARLRYYIPSDKEAPANVIKRLMLDETNPETLKNLEILLKNVSKINVPVSIVDDINEYGTATVAKFLYKGDGGSAEIVVNRRAYIDSERELRHILTHELNHAYSVGIIQNPQGEVQENFVRNLDRVYKEAMNLPSVKDEYGLTNVKEFLAELASNKDFRAKLRGGNLWSRIIRAFRKLLGFTDKFDAILEDYYNTLDKSETIQQPDNAGEDLMEKKEKKVGSKRIDLLDQMLASLRAREDRLKSKGKRVEAKQLEGNIGILEELAKTKRNEAVVKYLITVEEEMASLKQAYNLMAKDPGKVNPDALYAMREQLVSYKLLDAFSDQIHLNPEAFIPEGGNSEALLKSLDQLRADVHKMNNDTRRLAIQRFASVIQANLKDPNVTMDSIVDQLEVADRDIDWLNRWTEVGMEMDDIAVRTAHKMLTDNTLSAYRAIQDDLYSNETKKQETTVVLKVPNKKKGFRWETKKIEFTSSGMFNALNAYEGWLKTKGINPNSIVDKFAPILDTNSLEQNDNGVQLISPWSTAGKNILSIKEGSKDYPLRQFYETFVLGYLKSQENIPAFSLRPGLRIPSIQRSMLEGIIREEGKDKFTVLKERAIDAVRKRYDERDFKAVDENGKPQEYIPVRFVAKQDGKNGRLSTREVSLDLASTLPLFIHEMYSRKGLETLHSDLELGKLVLGEREVMKTRRVKGPGLTPWLTREREGIPLASGKFDTIKGEQSKSFEAYDSLLRRFLYGQVKKSEGDIEKDGKKFSVSKMVDSFLGFTGFKIMFGNLAIPLTNGIVGEISMMKEVVGGNLIDKRDYAYANKFFAQVALPSAQDLGRREKKTKAGRILTYFNPLDHNRAVTDLGVDTNWMRTIWNTVSRTGGSSIEFYLGAKAIGATFNRFKAKNSKGEEVPLYEAIEVSNSGKVTLSEGFTYNNKKSINAEDINQIRNYSLRVYQLMNGVYNTMDKPAVNEYAAGRLLFFMRNWLIPGIQARWKTKYFDERLQKENEGHYLSALIAFNNAYSKKGVLQGTIDSLRILTWFGSSNPELLLLPNELNLSEEEKENIINLRKSNIRKTLFEIYTIVALTAVMGLAWDDDDESYTKYMLARIRREVSTFYSPSTAWEVLRSPTVALNTVDGLNRIQGDLFDSLGAVIMGEEQPIYESGPYKGENKLTADMKRQLGLGFEKQFEDLSRKTRLIQRGGYK